MIKGISGILIGTVAAVLVLSGLAFSQQAWPTKPVTILHGYTAGSTVDLTSRIVGEALAKELKQPFVVTPKPGGGNTIALSSLVRSPADGYTIGIFPQGVLSTAPHIEKVDYKLEDVIPVMTFHTNPQVLVCRSDAPFKNLKELVAYAKTKPVTFGHQGKATKSFQVPYSFGKAAGIQLVDVPFKGDAEQPAAVLGGHIMLGSLGIGGSVEEFIAAGKIRALVTYAPQRISFRPEIPTFKDEGFADPVPPAVTILLVPKATPDAVVKRLHDAMRQVINDPKVKADFEKMRHILLYLDGPATLELIKRDEAISVPMLKEAGIIK